MGIFSRTRDIIAANFNDMLDKADDPQKMIRMIILEMEETLVEVRASAARTIADQKEMHRHTVKLDKLQADWGEKAQLAVSKDREDLARAALVETLENLTKTVQRPVLLSRAFAERASCSSALESLGTFPLRGVGEDMEVFAYSGAGCEAAGPTEIALAATS